MPRLQQIIVLSDEELKVEGLPAFLEEMTGKPLALPAPDKPESVPETAPEIMPDRFKICLPYIFAEEGGYSDHSSDPGGATNHGITQARLSEWRGYSVSKAEVKALTKAEAGEIYFNRYWLPAECDTLPPGIDLMVFNICVNAGVYRGQAILQHTLASMGLYHGAIDGDIGRVTADALAMANPREFITLYARRIEGHYRGLASLFKVFGKGWLARLKRVHDTAQKMAISAPSPALALISPPASGAVDEVGVEDEVKSMTLIDILLGGKALEGKKTIIGIVGYVAVVLAWNMGFAPDFLTPSMYETLYTLLAGLAGLGFVSKVERYAQMFGLKAKPIRDSPTAQKPAQIDTTFEPFEVK